MTVSSNKSSNRPGWLWVPDDTEAEDQSADFNAGLTSMGFIRAAIRRRWRFWVGMAGLGLLITAGLYLKLPPTYQASTSLFLTVGPESGAGTAIQNDQALAQSRAVAALALRKLGLQESPSSFVNSYQAAALTDRVLQITVSAPSPSDAVTRANAVATAFLGYRATLLETQQRSLFASLDQQVTQAKQQLASVDNQIRQLAAQPVSPARQSRLGRLRAERSQAAAALTAPGGLMQTVSSDKASSREQTTSEVAGSGVLDAAAPVPQSHHTRLKHLIIYAAAGLIPGLAFGIGAVVVGALISDRLRRRDDIARALGAPVKLSLGKVRLDRRLSQGRGLAALQGPNIRRIVAHLGTAVPARSAGMSTLAVVAVDDPRVAAISLASLACNLARQGGRVVVADLCAGSPLGGLLGVKEPGVRAVTVDKANLVVAIPEPDDFALTGPLGRSQAQASAFTDAVASACTSADILLTLVALDPGLGGEHLATWTSDAVVVVTAGRSSWTKINSVGEMIRLSGARLDSAVLIGADKTDESLGVTYTRDESLNVAQTRGAYPGTGFSENGLSADVEDSFAPFDPHAIGRQFDDT
jgi:capsular polysaccharide biosynthesis protein